MPDLIEYASTFPVPFKLTLNGIAVTGHTLAADDVQLSKDGGAFANKGSACAEVGLGWYEWTPIAADTTCRRGILNIKDASGVAFDETAVLFYTGGNINARYSG